MGVTLDNGSIPQLLGSPRPEQCGVAQIMGHHDGWVQRGEVQGGNGDVIVPEGEFREVSPSQPLPLGPDFLTSLYPGSQVVQAGLELLLSAGMTSDPLFPAGSLPFEGLNDSGSCVVLTPLGLHHGHQQPLAHGLEKGGVSIRVPGRACTRM